MHSTQPSSGSSAVHDDAAALLALIFNSQSGAAIDPTSIPLNLMTVRNKNAQVPSPNEVVFSTGTDQKWIELHDALAIRPLGARARRKP